EHNECLAAERREGPKADGARQHGKALDNHRAPQNPRRDDRRRRRQQLRMPSSSKAGSN
ncbi:hypothetical protein CHS0354_026925, partial [Potamilus streckersoni]